MFNIVSKLAIRQCQFNTQIIQFPIVQNIRWCSLKPCGDGICIQCKGAWTLPLAQVWYIYQHLNRVNSCTGAPHACTHTHTHTHGHSKHVLVSTNLHMLHFSHLHARANISTWSPCTTHTHAHTRVRRKRFTKLQ